MWSELILISLTVSSLMGAPLFSMLVLIFLTLYLSLKVGMLYMNWFFFTLMIIYMGGMMVMFSYLSSLTSMKKIFSNKFFLVSLSLLFLFVTVKLGLKNETATSPHLIWLSESFYSCSSPLIIISIVYLFAALVSVFKICEKTEGPMKSIN